MRNNSRGYHCIVLTVRVFIFWGALLTIPVPTHEVTAINGAIHAPEGKLALILFAQLCEIGWLDHEQGGHLAIASARRAVTRGAVLLLRWLKAFRVPVIRN